MRKRVLSILLTLCMVLCLVPTAALAADDINYGFSIGGTAVTSENIGNLPGVTGTVSYDPTSKTLTLNGVTITSSNMVALNCGTGVTVIA